MSSIKLVFTAAKVNLFRPIQQKMPYRHGKIITMREYYRYSIAYVNRNCKYFFEFVYNPNIIFEIVMHTTPGSPKIPAPPSVYGVISSENPVIGAVKWRMNNVTIPNNAEVVIVLRNFFVANAKPNIMITAIQDKAMNK